MLVSKKTAVITGASGGLGLGIAGVLAENGARIIALDFDIGRAETACAKLAEQGWTNSIPLAADVASSASVADAFRELDSQGEKVDILVNNAGVRAISNAIDLEPKVWDWEIGVNLSGPFYCSREAALRMRAAGGGAIVNISSIAGMVSVSNRPAYTASKHGLIGLTKSLAGDFAPFGIRANAVAPGMVRTPLSESYFHDEVFVNELRDSAPLGGAGEPADIGQAVLYLCSEMAKYVTGATLTVDGGFMAEKNFASPRSSAFRLKQTSA